MDKKFAIFDMDGTLVDSMPIWKNLAYEYLHSKGIENIPNQVMQTIMPMTLIESSKYFIDYFKLDCTPCEVMQDMSNIMEYHYKNDIQLKPKTIVYLNELNDKGVVMCVASSTSKYLMDACLSRLGIKNYFKFLLSSEEVGVGKTSPKVYLEAIKKMDATIEETAVFEDALFAIKTAKQAGFYTVGIYEKIDRDNIEDVKQAVDEFLDFY